MVIYTQLTDILQYKGILNTMIYLLGKRLHVNDQIRLLCKHTRRVISENLKDFLNIYM